MNLITVFDYLGVFIFAVSGALVAIRHNMDLFGVLLIGLLPAVGGGTLRDILLDVPVFWLSDPWVITFALLGGGSAIIYRYWTQVRALIWVDALGLSFFAMLGTVKAIQLGHGFVTVVIMGTITATAGGLIRDVVCGESPLLLKGDIYATAALAGSSVCYLALKIGVWSALSILLGFSLTLIIRVIAIHYKLSLPTTDWLRSKK